METKSKLPLDSSHSDLWLLNNEICAAPGRCRTLISHERLSILKGKENSSAVPLEIDAHPIVGKTKIMGEKLTSYFSRIWHISEILVMPRFHVSEIQIIWFFWGNCNIN